MTILETRQRGADDTPVPGSSHTLADGDVIDIAERGWRDAGFDRTAWRVRYGKACVMVRFFTPSNTQHPGVAVVCDVEVRDTHRGQRLALDTIVELGVLCGQPLHTSGSYTPSGHRALADHLPLVAGADPKVRFDDMVFVADWDERTRK